MLKPTYIELLQRYSPDTHLAEKLWSDIEAQYSRKNRHYHTLSHLESLVEQLKAAQAEIADWDTVLFALYYHDFIYKATSKENEEESAAHALEVLRKISYGQPEAKKCMEIILATKAHHTSDDHDTNLFTDADLSILGVEPEKYKEYAQQVRKEYSLYPDFLYKPGRKKVLKHFLEMKRIFKTDFFYDRYEQSARENLIRELEW